MEYCVVLDRSVACHVLHNELAYRDGVEVFTLSPKGLDKPPVGRAA